MVQTDPGLSPPQALPAAETCPLCMLLVRFPHAARAALLLCLAFAVAAAANLANPLGIRWTLSPDGRVGIPRIYEERLPEVSAKEALAMLKTHSAVFVDTRDAKDYKVDRIPGAINLPMRDWQNSWPKVRSQLPKGAYLLLYCYGGKCGLSTRAGKRLLELGYQHPIVLEYGWKEWQKAGYATEKTAKGRAKK